MSYNINSQPQSQSPNQNGSHVAVSHTTVGGAVNMRKMPRVTLKPTSRTAAVSSPLAVAKRAPYTNGASGHHAHPNYHSESPTPPMETHCDATIEAVQEAYQKTSAQLQRIEDRLEQLHSDIKNAESTAATAKEIARVPTRPPPPATTNTAVGPAQSPSTMNGGRLPNGTSPATISVSTSIQPETTQPNMKGANHHLTPIAATSATAAAAPASTVAPPPQRPVLSSPPTTSTAKAAATPPPAKPTPAPPSAPNPRMSLHPRFSIDEEVVATPDGSSSSNSDSSGGDSSSSDDEGSRGSGFLPAAAHRSMVRPKPPPRMEDATAVVPPSASAAGGAGGGGGGGATRQGFGFKSAGQHTATAAAPSDGSHEAPSLIFGSHVDGAKDAAAPSFDAGGDGGGEVVALGRKGRGKGITMEIDKDKPVEGAACATRRHNTAVKHMLEHFFAPFPRFVDIFPSEDGHTFNSHDIETVLLPGVPCSWLFCVSLAVSYVSGIPTPVEKILRVNHMGVHYISLPTITLAELYDVTNDYIHTRFHRSAASNTADCAADEFEEDEEAEKYLTPDEVKQLLHLHCEMATFDTEVLDPESEEDIHGMGEHPPISSLAHFRKELQQHMTEEKSMYIFNFDPYILEQAELRLRSNMCETEEESAAVMATARYSKDTGGCFGILVSFNPVQHKVTIMTPHMTKVQHPMHHEEDDEAAAAARGEDVAVARDRIERLKRFAGVSSNLVMEEYTISVQTLYDATRQVDSYSLLSRGFVRVFINESFDLKVPSIFPLFVLDGSSAGGLVTSVLDLHIAPHILGLAVLHHLAITFLLTDSARRKQSSRNLLSKANVCDVKLRGIPLTKVCQQLRLPLSMIVCESDKSSIATAYAWYHFFLQQLQINKDIRVGLVLPQRRDGASDGLPNITDTEFIEHLQLVVGSQSVMLISFDVNVALNVRLTEREEPAHFAVVIGLDEARGIVRLADVNVKRFRKTWHIPLNRLYNAMMGYGYMVASKDKKLIKALNSKQYEDSVLQCAKYFLPPPPPTLSNRFDYPTRPYPITVLADAVERLGFLGTNVEKFLNFSGFHISYFLSKEMPLEGAAFVVQNFSHHALDDALSVVRKHYDFYDDNPPPTTEEAMAMAAGGGSGASKVVYTIKTEADFLQDIEYALACPEKRKLLVKYDRSVLMADPAVWNGRDSSCFAIVVDYDAATQTVMLSDANVSSFYRTFACPLSVMYRALCSWDPIDLRARGSLLLTTEVMQEGMYDNTKGYDMAHALVHHPFKTMFSAACSCLALAATEMMMNIETPMLLNGAPLSIEEDEKRKYRRYNNIFSAEDFLYALPSFSVHEWRTQPIDRQDVMSIANNAFVALKLPLQAVDATTMHPAVRTDAMELLRACGGVSGLFTITLVSYDTGVLYGVPGTSVGLVNRIIIAGEEDDRGHVPEGSAGTIQLLEGDPCRWGACCDCTAEELRDAITGVYLIEEVPEEETDE